MSITLLWGTSITPDGSNFADRITSAGDLRVTSSGDVRSVSVPGLPIVYDRATAEGDIRVTAEGDIRVVIYGLLGPQYFESSNATSDGGEAFAFQFTTNPWQPQAQGGECVFAWAYLAFSYSLGVTVQVTPVVDGDSSTLTMDDGSTLAPITSSFTFAQQTGNLQRLQTVVAVPLVRVHTRNGDEVNRFYLRGERLQLVIQSTGPLGVGELTLDGIEVEFEPVRKAIYPNTVTT